MVGPFSLKHCGCRLGRVEVLTEVRDEKGGNCVLVVKVGINGVLCGADADLTGTQAVRYCSRWPVRMVRSVPESGEEASKPPSLQASATRPTSDLAELHQLTDHQFSVRLPTQQAAKPVSAISSLLDWCLSSHLSLLHCHTQNQDHQTEHDSSAPMTSPS